MYLFEHNYNGYYYYECFRAVFAALFIFFVYEIWNIEYRIMKNRFKLTFYCATHLQIGCMCGVQLILLHLNEPKQTMNQFRISI